MDQGVIYALAAMLCSMTVCKLKSASKRKAPKLTVSILSYMVMLRKIWNAISNKTFINCFKDADFSKEAPSMIKMIPSLDFKTSKSTQFRPCSPILLVQRKTFNEQVDTDTKLD